MRFFTWLCCICALTITSSAEAQVAACDPTRAFDLIPQQATISTHVGHPTSHSFTLHNQLTLDIDFGLQLTTGDLESLEEYGEIGVAPAFRAGPQFDLFVAALDHQHVDLQINVVPLALGYGEDEELIMLLPPIERLTIASFTGLSIEFAEILEAGYAYNWAHHAHMLLFAVGPVHIASDAHF